MDLVGNPEDPFSRVAANIYSDRKRCSKFMAICSFRGFQMK